MINLIEQIGLKVIHNTIDPLFFLIPGLILLGVAIYLRLTMED